MLTNTLDLTKIKNGFDIHSTKGSLSTIQKETPSIAIISLHKCATSFLSKTVIQDSATHKAINYQSYHYKNDIKIAPIIHKYGYLYGILRVYDPKHPSDKLTMDLLYHKNMKHIKTLFWVRDPRDILVSMYFSFGFTHGLSPHPAIRAFQEKRQTNIQALTLDQYVIQEAYAIKDRFDIIFDLMQRYENKLFLKYEDMIHRYDYFYSSLNDFLTLDHNMSSIIYNATRPNEIEDKSSHKRSGKTGAYLDKLKPETIDQLNIILDDILKKFNYSKEI